MLYWSILPLTLVSFKLEGIHKELHSLRHVDLKKELIIHLQHRIIYIIVIYVFCTLLMHTNNYIKYKTTTK
jgi:hypothetical protein